MACSGTCAVFIQYSYPVIKIYESGRTIWYKEPDPQTGQLTTATPVDNAWAFIQLVKISLAPDIYGKLMADAARRMAEYKCTGDNCSCMPVGDVEVTDMKFTIQKTGTITSPPATWEIEYDVIIDVEVTQFAQWGICRPDPKAVTREILERMG